MVQNTLTLRPLKDRAGRLFPILTASQHSPKLHLSAAVVSEKGFQISSSSAQIAPLQSPCQSYQCDLLIAAGNQCLGIKYRLGIIQQ